ncbi:MAG: hypothetical protein ACOCXT_04880 [Candidatus Dojkabacteria bacterium]
MSTTKLQIPMNSSLKKQADKKAKEQGFSSVQEVIRVFLTGYIKGDISPVFITTSQPNPPIQQTTTKRHSGKKEIEIDIEEKIFTVEDSEELLRKLKL